MSKNTLNKNILIRLETYISFTRYKALLCMLLAFRERLLAILNCEAFVSMTSTSKLWEHWHIYIGQ